MMNGSVAVILLLALLAGPGVASSQTVSPEDTKRLQSFERQVDDLCQRLKVPGLSVAIIKDQKLIWAKGFGFADVEKKIPATPDTLYHLASITKTFGATLIMQLVEQGKLSLDEPVSRYSSAFKDDSVQIKHLITHTAKGTPGKRFQYDGNNFDHLDAVIEKKTGKKFTQLAVETFFDPLGMTNSVPYHNVVVDADKWMASLGKERLDRYAKNLEAFAQPYTYYGAGEIILDGYPGRHYNGSAASLLSTVTDMAKYDIGTDRHMFLKKETQEAAWTPFVSNAGQRLPYGLGWFVTDHRGIKLVWHYGHWGTGFSSLYLKVPEKNLALIMLSNSESMVDHQFQGEMSAEVVINNVFACGFLGMWEIAYGCEKNSQAAAKKWIEQRRSRAKVAIRVDPKVLASYVGQYQFEQLGNRIFTITSEGDKLFVQQTGGSRMEMLAESETKFFSKIRSWTLIFLRSKGQPVELRIVEGNATFSSKRIN